MQGISKTPKQEKERRKKLKLTKLEDKNPMWKGDNVGYDALHDWIETHKPKSQFCEKCGRETKLDLANISGKYKRDINDFEWLCRSCHMIKDGRMNNFRKTFYIRKHKGDLIQCTKCKEFKLKGDFWEDKRTLDGLRLNCKDCWKRYYQKNKERISKQKKEHYQKNKESLKEYGKEYYQKNKEKILEKKKEYSQKPEVKERVRIYLKEYHKEYHQKNKERINKIKREKYKKLRNITK